LFTQATIERRTLHARSLATTLQNKQKDDVGFASAAVMGVLVRQRRAERAAVPPCHREQPLPCAFITWKELAARVELQADTPARQLTRVRSSQAATLLAKGYGLDEEDNLLKVS
jgi:hypothetical protein